MFEAERPRFHLTPAANWMNDPNGLIFAGPALHAFYQYNPDAPRWGRMSWGHAVSDDLVTWTNLPVAIQPDPGGPDSSGCWSGCIVPGPVATMFYTGVIEVGDHRRASICRAFGHDGLTNWDKDPRNPVIARPPDGIARDAFRDPFVWHDGGSWAMLVGAGTEDGRAAVLLYRSADLADWTYIGPFLSMDDIDRTAGADGPVWECPQLIRDGNLAALIVSVVDRTPGVRPSHVTGFVGRVEGDRFRVDHAGDLGMGPDFYA
ncbi:MAG: glycoside hydrolase family 32 protein, partial [Candidatus Limnocylindrales bacterium]